MLAQERHRKILAAIQENGTVSLRTLQTLCPVSNMTLWRDLRCLEEKKMLARVRGGVTALHVSEEPYFNTKRATVPEIKQRLAAAAARLVKEGGIVILEGGTTVAEIVPRLEIRSLTLLTNSMPVLNRSLGVGASWEVLASGGHLRHVSGTFVGSEAVQFFQTKKADCFFLSATGLDKIAGLTDPNLQEIDVKRAMANSARRVVALVDSTKIGKVTLTQILPFSRIHTLIVDSGVSSSDRRWLRKMIPEVILVP